MCPTLFPKYVLLPRTGSCFYTIPIYHYMNVFDSFIICIYKEYYVLSSRYRQKRSFLHLKYIKVGNVVKNRDQRYPSG